MSHIRDATVPSLYEGFGLPALEGMACGGAAARTGVLPEVCQDAASLAEGTVEVLTDGIAQVLGGPELTDGIAQVLGGPELADRLRRKGPGRADAFTWDGAARAHVEVYDVAGGRQVSAGSKAAGA
ncbi:MAG: hypothetical protein ACRDZ8_08895 [Acidimicrobiales bacterium]